MDGLQFTSPIKAAKWAVKQALVPLNRALTPSTAARYLANTTEPKLHFGCSARFEPGWLNSDINILPLTGRVLLDSTRTPWPLPANSIKYIYSHHVLEHMSFQLARQTFEEFGRILQPDGRIRIVVPDLASYMQAYAHFQQNPDDPCLQEFLTKDHAHPSTKAMLNGVPHHPMAAINACVYGHGHVFMYDEDLLRTHFEAAGFKNITRKHTTDYGNPVFDLGHEHPVDPKIRWDVNLILEATK